eukprot:TRINITY_DN1780_c0_g1_i11.p1 TRINITY_DN1780_c0_g1~~TRINITY_DN1780_c0_g1_i11.p1  ORF type:complete len:198 (+),score=18.29 TRINITY_DN1780_c0_g1_i11:178-771(+)
MGQNSSIVFFGTNTVRFLLSDSQRCFSVLIEKEWGSFGHKFQDRIGHLRSKKSERSPIFLQWLDCVWQIFHQFPHYFEFTEEFLISIADATYNSIFSTFLTNCEKERKLIEPRTVSFWTTIKAKPKYINPIYLRREGSIWPCTKHRVIKLWENYWLRWDPNHKPRFMAPIFNELFANYKKKVLTDYALVHNSNGCSC